MGNSQADQPRKPWNTRLRATRITAANETMTKAQAAKNGPSTGIKLSSAAFSVAVSPIISPRANSSPEASGNATGTPTGTGTGPVSGRTTFGNDGPMLTVAKK